MIDPSPDPSSRPLWPGQAESMFFDLAQVRTLCSPIRALVHWGLDSYEAKSAADVGAEIGKTPQTIRYHLTALLDLGLILAVGTRRRRSRTEILYVRSARRCFTRGDGDAEYNRYVVRALKLDAQKLVREAASFYGWREHDPSAAVYSAYRHFHLTLSADRAKKLKADLRDLLFAASFEQIPASEGGVEIHAFAAMMPTLFQTRAWAKSAGIPFRDLNRDGPVEGEDFPAD